ncbi:MAG: hypothetical protein HC819_12985 [Cyclobacteriaceae bacterium]|nr:hypothetical protein [Cyclobacteriaceae bacterium]
MVQKSPTFHFFEANYVLEPHMKNNPDKYPVLYAWVPVDDFKLLPGRAEADMGI